MESCAEIALPAGAGGVLRQSEIGGGWNEGGAGDGRAAAVSSLVSELSNEREAA